MSLHDAHVFLCIVKTGGKKQNPVQTIAKIKFNQQLHIIEFRANKITNKANTTKQTQRCGHRQTYLITFSLLTIATAAGTQLSPQSHVGLDDVDVSWMWWSFDLTLCGCAVKQHKNPKT